MVKRLLPVRDLTFFFFNDTATTEIYTLSLHDALPISRRSAVVSAACWSSENPASRNCRSEEHTSELQSHSDLVCRLLLEKKKTSLALAFLTVIMKRLPPST